MTTPSTPRDRRPRRKRRVAAFLAIAAVVLILAARLALEAPWLEQRIAREIEAAASEATGLTVEVGDAELLFRPFGVRLSDISARDEDGPTGAELPRVEVRLRLLPLLAGDVQVLSIDLEEPVVTYAASFELPAAEEAASASEDPWSIALGRLDVEGARVTYLDPAADLRVDIAGLDVSSPRLLAASGDASLDIAAAAVSLDVAAADIDVRLGETAVEDLAASGSLALRDGVLRARELRVSHDRLGALGGEASVALPAGDSDVSWELDAEGTLDVAALAAGTGEALPADVTGEVAVAIDAEGEGSVYRADVALRSERLVVRELTVGDPPEALRPVVVEALRVQVSATPDRLVVESFEASLLGGRVSGAATLPLGEAGDDGSGRALQLRVDATGLDVGAIPLPAELAASLPPIRGRIDIEAQGALPLGEAGGAPRIGFRLDLTPPEEAGGREAIAPRLTARGRWAAEGLDLEEARLDALGARLEVSGLLAEDGTLGLDIDARVPRLEATATRLSEVGWLPSPLEDRDLTGALRFTGRVEGTVDEPRVAGALAGRALALDGTRLGDVSADVRATAETLQVTGGRVEGGLLRAAFDALVPLAAPERVTASVRFEDLELADAAALATGEVSDVVTGRASGTLRVEPDATGAPRGVIDLAVDDASVAGQALGRVTTQAEATAERLALLSLDAARGEGTLHVSGTLPWTGAPRAQDGLRVRISDWPLGGEDGGPAPAELGGRLDFQAEVGGSLAAPEISAADVVASDLTWTPVAEEGEDVTPIGPVTLAATARLEDGTLHVVLDPSRGAAGGVLRLAMTPGETSSGTITIDSLQLPLPPEPGGDDRVVWLDDLALSVEGSIGARAAAPAGGRIGADGADGADGTEGGTVDGGDAFALLEGLTWRLSVGDAELIGGSARASLAEPLVVEGAGRAVELLPMTVLVRGEELTVAGEAFLDETPRWLVRAHGALDLAAIDPLIESGRLAGAADIDLRASGRGTVLDLAGELVLEDGYFRPVGFPHSLRNLHGRVELAGDRLRLEEIRATLGGGLVEASGFVRLEDFAPAEYRFEASGDSVALRYPDDLRTLSNFDVELAGDRDGSLLSGRIDVLRGRYTETLNVERRALSRRVEPAGGSGRNPLADVRLDLELVARDSLWIDNDLAKVELAADLDIVGTAANPVLVGTVVAVAPGTLRLQGIDYRLLTATFTFTLASPNEPDLDIVAETTLKGYEITVRVTGSVSSPRLALSSSPDLPTERIVALLASRGLVGAEDISGSVPGAFVEDYLAGRLVPATNALSAATGLDVVELDPLLLTGDAGQAARLTLGKKLSEKLTVSYTTYLGGAEESSVEIRYQWTPHLMIREARESDGSNVIEARWTKSFYTTPEAAIEESAETAASVEDGEAFLVGELRLAGIPDPPGEDAVREALEISSDDSVRPRDLSRAAWRARERLSAAGRPLASVRCKADGLAPSELGGGGEATRDVTCTVEPGPPVELVIEGLPDEKQGEALVELVRERWGELAFLDELADEARLAVLEALHEAGRWHATVTATLETDDADSDDAPRRVVLSVDQGPVVRVADARVEGVESLELDRVRKVLRSTGFHLRDPRLTPDHVAEEAESVAALYRQEGWLDVEVEALEPEHPKARDEAVVVLSVTEGELARLGGVRFEGSSVLDASELHELLGLGSGDVLRPTEVDRFQREVIGRLDAIGHPDVFVDWHLLRGEDGRFDLVVEIEEGPRVEVGTIRIVGLRKTKEKTVRRAIDVEAGQPFSRDALLEARRAVETLGLFRRVEVRGQPRPQETGVRDVLIRVTERPDLGVQVGGGWDDEEGPFISTAVELSNLKGVGHSWVSALRLGTEELHAETSLVLRRPKGIAFDLISSAFLREEEEPGFTVRRTGLSFEASRPLFADARLLVGYRIEKVSLSDLDVTVVDPDIDETVIAKGLFSWQLDRRDDPLSPSEGLVTGLDLGVSAQALGSDVDFARLLVRHAQYRPFGTRRIVHALSVRVGAALTWGGLDRLPLSERFRAGGVATIRGFSRDRVGPKDPVTDEPLGGDALFILAQELRLPVTDRIDAIAFLDLGNVYDSVSDLDPFDVRMSAGPGIGIDTPVGPIRIFHAFVLDPERGEDDMRFHFTFGATF